MIDSRADRYFGEGQHSRDAQSFSLYMANATGSTHGSFEKDVLDGVVLLEHAGLKNTDDMGGALYAAPPASEIKKGTEAATLRLIPYYAWANREPSMMQVWVPLSGG